MQSFLKLWLLWFLVSGFALGLVIILPAGLVTDMSQAKPGGLSLGLPY